jgi:hypothetical protein
VFLIERALVIGVVVTAASAAYSTTNRQTRADADEWLDRERARARQMRGESG